MLTIEKTAIETCDIWDTAYNSDNWEPEFMTIIVTWQLIVTLVSIKTVKGDVQKKFLKGPNFWHPEVEFYRDTLGWTQATKYPCAQNQPL